MTSERIKEIQEETAYPESVSVMLALKQVWNECAQESYSKEEVKSIINFIMIQANETEFGSLKRFIDKQFKQFEK